SAHGGGSGTWHAAIAALSKSARRAHHVHHARRASRAQRRSGASGAPRGKRMPSFDAVSELNAHEVTNAIDQANRELAQRFDFKDTGARFELKEFTVTLHAQVDFQLRQMLEMVKLRLAKRGIHLACLDIKEPRTPP